MIVQGFKSLYKLIKEKWDNLWSGPENKYLVPYFFEEGYRGLLIISRNIPIYIYRQNILFYISVVIRPWGTL